MPQPPYPRVKTSGLYGYLSVDLYGGVGTVEDVPPVPVTPPRSALGLTRTQGPGSGTTRGPESHEDPGGSSRESVLFQTVPSSSELGRRSVHGTRHPCNTRYLTRSLYTGSSGRTVGARLDTSSLDCPSPGPDLLRPVPDLQPRSGPPGRLTCLQGSREWVSWTGGPEWSGTRSPPPPPATAR